ncbi:MAG: nitroreductase [Gammaproteobacteria bacterium]|nr:nitroreductase [Gammaproteobacteria bacterium]MDH4255032.1 nitroreductase [Gammaproteobacteria bacterium]MDH5309267.1 nitroreductase [Gammaproteobacteria bacterium]
MSDAPVQQFDKSLQRLAERIRSRRTVKLFLKQPVSTKLILEAIEVARWAPNHHLTEPWHFYLLGRQSIAASVDLIRVIVTERKDAKVGEFKAQDAATRPGWLVVTCRKSDDALRQQEDYASVCCAIQNFSLYLSEAGLASKWSTGEITRDQRFYDLLGIDTEQEFIVGLIWYGYPKITPTQQRREVAEIVTELD